MDETYCEEEGPLKPLWMISVVLLIIAPAFSRADENAGAPGPDLSSRVRSLVAQLGDPRYQIREAAQRELSEMKEEVMPILEAIPVPSDLEIQWRLNLVRWQLKWRRSGSSSIQGTRWFISFPNGDTNLKPHVIQFQANGKFLDPKSSKTPDDETWEYAQGMIRFHYNNKFSTYVGKRISTEKMAGTAHNVKGKSWTWELTLVVDDRSVMPQAD